MKVFVTGAAGFVGFHISKKLLDLGHIVVGYDGMTDYYDVSLKRKRLDILNRYSTYDHVEAMLEDAEKLNASIDAALPDVLIHLAAQAGVRYSLDHPETYITSNIVGSYNILEAAKRTPLRHLLIASSSSIYGANRTMPFAEGHKSDWPISLYAATKKAVEEISHSYASLWNIPITCFRFFTVYGPWGRPDMALFKFVSAIERNVPIEIYGEGKMKRDFTYIDDLVESIVRLMDIPPSERNRVQPEDALSPVAPWRVVNIGGGQPVGLLDFIETVERCLGKTAQKIFLPMQKGDVEITYADPSLLQRLTGYQPRTDLRVGVSRCVEWYLSQILPETPNTHPQSRRHT